MTSAIDIMLVEDDESLGFLIKDALDSHGWRVHLYRDGEKGLSAFHSHVYDLCILDIMLPEKDGFTLASEIRKYNQQVPIIFLTAKNQTQDKIHGFQVGADDYVCKPFSIEEFKYRVEAILKRTYNATSDKPTHELKVSQCTLDVKNLVLRVVDHETRLTHTECQLLQMFFRHPGQLIERDIFLKAIWEENGFFVARSMDVFVSKLRKHLKPDAALRIDNVRGIGYVLHDNSKGPLQR
jgi:DNA-binding response OmpR family regulator